MLDPHQERDDDGHEYGGRLGGPLQGETGGEGCKDGDGRGRRHPPVRVQSVNAGGVALGTRGRAQRRGRRGTRRIELKKFSLRPEKYDGKVDFEGWVNQFEEYAALGQWTEEEKSSLLFLSLTAGARMYFVGLPERGENGIREQSGGPQASVWTRNRHQHRSTGVGRTETRKESVRQRTGRQCEAVGQPGLSL